MKHKKKSYNPWKMGGSWAGAILAGITLFIVDSNCGTNSACIDSSSKWLFFPGNLFLSSCQSSFPYPNFCLSGILLLVSPIIVGFILGLIAEKIYHVIRRRL